MVSLISQAKLLKAQYWDSISVKERCSRFSFAILAIGSVGCAISAMVLFGAVAFSMPSAIFIAEKGIYLGITTAVIGFIVFAATSVADELKLIG